MDIQRKKALQRERTKRYREKKSVTLTGSNVTQGVTEDQIDRFPNIPSPFGPAYYEALGEKRVKYA